VRKIGVTCNALANKSVESGVPRRVAPRPYGKARPEGPSRRATVFMLRPAGPKVEALRAEAKFWVWLICYATVASQILDRPKLSCQRVFRREPARHAPSIDRLRDFPSHRSVLLPLKVPILCIIAEKALKMAHFSQTGSRNMAETRVINFLTLVSYSTSIVIWGLRRLLPSFLM